MEAIVAAAEANDYRMSSFLTGVIESDAFRYSQVPVVVVEEASSR